MGRHRIRRYIALVLTICLGCLLGVLLGGISLLGSEASPSPAPQFALPVPQVHPLPATLAEWQDPNEQGDYFDQIKVTDVGYLVWSRFPVRVYVEQPVVDRPDAAKVAAWTQAVTQGVGEWSRYLPLAFVKEPDLADITIWRVVPPLQREPGNDARSPVVRARSAETRYHLYRYQTPNNPPVLVHRCQIQLSPNQTIPYIRAAARHEMGHALGIWGHSLLQSDVMYFSQVRTPPLISVRDVNTLKRIYQQPTRLGGVIPTDP